VIYRPYSPSDFDALFAVEEICFEPPHRFARRYMRQLVDNANAATWIAEEEGQIAGFAIVEWSREQDQTIAYLDTIEVGPEWRGQGVGAELLRRVEGSASTAGAEILWLHVDAGNRPAIRLYLAHCYLLKGREDGYYGRGRAALVYAKSFTAS
jgi:ribosomal protein S18 acetylase RimI-like enzyme